MKVRVVISIDVDRDMYEAEYDDEDVSAADIREDIINAVASGIEYGARFLRSVGIIRSIEVK